MLLPPCTHTMTGSCTAAFAGRQMFKYRQSSDPTVLPSDVPIVTSYLLFRPGPYRRLACAHAFPNRCVGLGEVQGSASAGAFQRRSPTGGLAYGTPFQAYVPLVAERSLPTTGPNVVCRSVGGIVLRSGDAVCAADGRTFPALLTSRTATTIAPRRRTALIDRLTSAPFGPVCTFSGASRASRVKKNVGHPRLVDRVA